MSVYFDGREAPTSRRPRTRSLCSRCGNVQQRRPQSPWRGGWSSDDKGQGLSLERDGREGRQMRRRDSSSDMRSQKGSSLHCYILPVTNGTGGGSTQTTYREAFRSHPSQGHPRHVRSSPSSPVSASPLWSSSSSSPRTTPTSLPKQSFSDADTHALLSRLPSRLRERDVSNSRNNTTYRDHFTWLS